VRFNTGEGLRMASEIGASPYGNGQAVLRSVGAAQILDLRRDQFRKHSNPSHLVNATGERFVVRAADFSQLHLTKYGVSCWSSRPIRLADLGQEDEALSGTNTISAMHQGRRNTIEELAKSSTA